MSAPRFRTLDVRPLIKSGTEPFSIVRKTVDSLKSGETLLLISPFLPSPLIEILQNEGFQARPERLSDGSWQTHLSRGKA
jgi:uncharacterized protein (DUF2249 family)